jgi:preprotein translocase SecE subunit
MSEQTQAPAATPVAPAAASTKRWYIVHAYSGMEKAVERNIRERINRAGMQDMFGEILVPTEEVVEIKNGQKRTSEPGKQLIGFGRDSVKEVRKVVWPTRKEAMQMTGYVFAFVFVMALYLWLTDKTLEWVLYDLVLGWRR